MTVRADFYVYVLFRETGQPFYVGMGRGGRWTYHERSARAESPADGNRRKLAIIRKILATRIDMPKVKVAIRLTHDQACAYEMAWIAALGRAPDGPLVNLTSGGEGGHDPSAETRGRIGAFWRGREKSPKHIANVAAANRGKTRSPEFCAKMRALRQGKPLSDEARVKIGIFWSGKTRSIETRAKISAARRGMTFSDEHRANLRTAWERRRTTLMPPPPPALPPPAPSASDG